MTSLSSGRGHPDWPPPFMQPRKARTACPRGQRFRRPGRFSSHIENYLGFPSGITGRDLSDRAFIQAEKFGPQVSVAYTFDGVRCDRQPFLIRCTGNKSAQGRTVVIASGAEYRKLSIPNLNLFEGVGVYYDATVLEAQLCTNEEVAVVGAALYLF